MQTKWKGDGKWNSPFNGTLAETRLPEKILFHDTTLRDGAQTPGVSFSREERKEIAYMLDETGVDRIEAGIFAGSLAAAKSIEDIVSCGLRAQTACVVNADREEISAAAQCGAQRVMIISPIGEPELQNKDERLQKTMILQIVNACDYARHLGLKTTIFMMDSGRARIAYLEQLLMSISSVFPDSVAIVDTVGCLHPGGVSTLLRTIRPHIPQTLLEVHMHNDFGLAVANTLAALESGVQVAHVCVNGLGKRAGNASLEQLAAALHALYDCQTGINLSNLTMLSQLVASKSGIPISCNQPIVGTSVF